MTLLSPEELQRLIEANSQIPGITAQLDQQQAALDANRNTGILWAALVLLCGEHGGEAAKVMALHHMRLFLAHLPDEEMAALTSYLLADIMQRIIRAEHGGNVTEAVESMIGPHMPIFLKFVATSGDSCPSCGAEKGWGDHECDNGVDDVEE